MRFITILDRSPDVEPEIFDLMAGMSQVWIRKGVTIRSTDPFDQSYLSMDMEKVERILKFVPYMNIDQALVPFYAPAVASVLGHDLVTRSELVVCHVKSTGMVGLNWVTTSLAKQLKIGIWNLSDEKTKTAVCNLLEKAHGK